MEGFGFPGPEQPCEPGWMLVTELLAQSWCFQCPCYSQKALFLFSLFSEYLCINLPPFPTLCPAGMEAPHPFAAVCLLSPCPQAREMSCSWPLPADLACCSCFHVPPSRLTYCFCPTLFKPTMNFRVSPKSERAVLDTKPSKAYKLIHPRRGSISLIDDKTPFRMCSALLVGVVLDFDPRDTVNFLPFSTHPL